MTSEDQMRRLKAPFAWRALLISIVMSLITHADHLVGGKSSKVKCSSTYCTKMPNPKCHHHESQPVKVQTHCGKLSGHYESQKLKRPKKYTDKIKTDACKWPEEIKINITLCCWKSLKSLQRSFWLVATKTIEPGPRTPNQSALYPYPPAKDQPPTPTPNPELTKLHTKVKQGTENKHSALI